MVQPAKDRMRNNVSEPLDLARVGRVLEADATRPTSLSYRQLELFRPDSAKLEWRQLPAEVRGKTTRLMARMLHELQNLMARDRTTGGDDDE